MNTKKIRFFVLATLLLAIFMTTFPAVYAQGNDLVTKEAILSLDSANLLKTLEVNGMQLPSDYQQHRDMAQSFVSNYVPLLIEGKVNPYVAPFNYDQSNQMLSELTRILTKMNVLHAEPFRYTLQNSTAIGYWNNSYLYYNCYAYSLGWVSGLQPGAISNTPFSMSLSISQMADVVLADLDAMGYWGYKTVTKPTSLLDQCGLG